MKITERVIAKDALSTKYEVSFDRDITLDEAEAFVKKTYPELLSGEQSVYRVMDDAAQEIEEELKKSGNQDHLNDEYFLAAMRESLCDARKAAETGDLLGLFYEARRLGRLEAELVIRRRALRRAEVGKKQLDSGETGNATRSAGSFKAIHGALAQRRADELHRENPDFTWTLIRKKLSKEFKVSAETIKKALTNPKKNG